MPPEPPAATRRPWQTAAFRLSALVSALFVLATAAILGLLYWQTSGMLARQAQADVSAEMTRLIAIAQASGEPALAARVASLAEAHDRFLYRLARPDGALAAGNLRAPVPELSPATPTAVFSYRTSPEGGEHLAIGSVHVLPSGARLVVAADVEPARRLADRLRWWFIAALVAIAALALVAGIAIARAVLARIERMRRASARIMAGALDERIPLAGSGDELDALADSLNAMLDRIETLMLSLREVSDNIAHDLKTPLTRLRARLETTLREVSAGDTAGDMRASLETALDDADGMIRTFNAMLLIAKLEAGAVESTLETFDLADVVADAAELYEPVAEVEGVPLTVDVSSGMHVRANRQLVVQALTNLIENALKYGRSPSGESQIRLALAHSGGHVVLSVADRGPGIRVADRARALTRFGRLDQSRSKPGTGLGLSLVAAVARLHGGWVRLEDNAPGLRVELGLPAVHAAGEASAQ